MNGEAQVAIWRSPMPRSGLPVRLRPEDEEALNPSQACASPLSELLDPWWASSQLYEWLLRVRYSEQVVSRLDL